MKTHTSVLKIFSACLIFLFVSGCAATVKFAYEVQKPPFVENNVNSSATIYLSLVDLRSNPAIIGYMENTFGMRVKTIKTNELDITNSIKTKYKEELSKNGFKFSDNENNSDLKLTLSITTFLGELQALPYLVVTKADCCMIASLISGKDNTEIYKTNVCGKGEKGSMIIGGKNEIPEALSFAVDSVLSKLLNETELIKSINKFK